MKWDSEGDVPRRWGPFEWRVTGGGVPVKEFTHCYTFVSGLNFHFFGLRLYLHIHIGGDRKPKYRPRCFQLELWKTKRGVHFDTRKPALVKSWVTFSLLPGFMRHPI